MQSAMPLPFASVSAMPQPQMPGSSLLGSLVQLSLALQPLPPAVPHGKHMPTSDTHVCEVVHCAVVVQPLRIGAALSQLVPLQLSLPSPPLRVFVPLVSARK